MLAGTGLSYTTWSLNFAQAPTEPVGVLQPASYIVEVKNTGHVVGNMAVLCFVAAPAATVTAAAALAQAVGGAPLLAPPVRSVFDFARVEALAAGASILLSFELSAEHRALVNVDGVWSNPPGEWSVVCEAGSMAKTPVATLTVV